MGRRSLATLLLAGVATALLGYYCWKLKIGPVELLRCVFGLLTLWLPFGSWIYLSLKNEIRDVPVRLAVSGGGSYATTTFFYFAATAFHCGWMLYTAQAAATIGLVILAVRRRTELARSLARARRIDWILTTLICASMVANIPVQDVWQVDRASGNITYSGWMEQLYHIGQAYELSRHAPPKQATIRGGSPERAYHHLMAMTTMLVGRYTGQTDLLRAHYVYHYGAIQFLICLLLYGIGKTLGGSRLPGYFALSLMYVAVLPAPNLWHLPDWPKTPIFYFTLFPHASSGVDLVATASPQMYSGIVLLYTGMLGLLVILKLSTQRRPVVATTLVTAVVFAALTRFRIHITLLAVPLFIVFLLYLWQRTRRTVFLAAAAVTFALAGAAYIEMKLGGYLQGTANLRIGYSDLHARSKFYVSWPFADTVVEWLKSLSSRPEIVNWSSEVVCLSMFGLLNIIGLPLIVATVFCVTRNRRSVFAPFSYFTVAAVLGSIVCSFLLGTEYDDYSVGGQLLFHTRWYLFPFAGVAVWALWRALQKRLAWSRQCWISIATVLLGGALAYRLSPPWSSLRDYINRHNVISITEDQWSALLYLRHRTPPDSIVLFSPFWRGSPFAVSGLGGRAAYLEYPGNPVDRLSRSLNPGDDRRAILRDLKASADEEQFCHLLRTTPATHLLEFAEDRWPLHPNDCLTKVWESPQHRVTIWQVNTPSSL